MPRRTDLGKLPKCNGQASCQVLQGVQAGDCAGCGEHFAMWHLELDHITSRNRGGNRSHPKPAIDVRQLQGHQGARGMACLRAKLQLPPFTNGVFATWVAAPRI